ncbi:Organic hydroperoxide resistance transcriptional regulator [compost metagenome]|jgi:MarR family transcriptional regulator, organic hydroperoxide resistance regulator|uniref:MarR family winged helix-turn-helix transcriptional regulator n=1 Tax=Paenibacillus TaxID=44249 RepID=UPI000FC2AB81|nr:MULTISPECIES: MarR family transcriptional regulator [Paenibacillus]MUG85042.1 MarR family transcriptional regulator [Paenibacillus timonensis]GIP47684.1 MarR family transcriptional regulator [Paenibacillus sp. J53TS2]
MNTEELMKLDNQLCFAFYTCSREIMKLYRPLLAEFGLTYTQYITLLALWERDGVTVKELGAMLYLDSGTLTPLLKKLEQMNLVTRTRDKADERSVIIELTHEGKALKDKACTVPMRLFAGTGAEVEDITAMHRQINEFMHKIGGGSSTQPEQPE